MGRDDAQMGISPTRHKHRLQSTSMIWSKVGKEAS
jgi:hypothetical protein